MKRTLGPAVALAERLCRPQRIGVFGHRGVGKTTLLTMLYREAVGGRLPGLRLAAADARTANYLADKVLQLEAGQPLPATLGETELRFHLYHPDARLDLLIMDYQGEHVALGREEPIRDFLRECDAVWLCLDVPVAEIAGPRLQAQQEVEQLVEDYLTAAPGSPGRPTALVLTKADLLPQGERYLGPTADPGAVKELVDQRFSMTRHALELHCPQHALLAVSSLGATLTAGEPFTPRPAGLDAPLNWLASALRAQDEERLKQVWELAGKDLGLLERCVNAFARRYPNAPATAAYRTRLRTLRQQRRMRRLQGVAAVAACLFLGLWGYDAWGARQAERFALAHPDDPAAVRDHWRSFQAWHPTRNWLRPAAAQAEQEHLRDLDAQARARERAERLADLRRRAADPDADAEDVWQRLQAFHRDYQDHDVEADWKEFRARVKARHDAERERRAEADFYALQHTRPKTKLAAQVEQADRFLRVYGDTSHASEVRRLRAAWLLRIDERDLDEARSYSATRPLNFHTRREHYRRYLERHPEGAFVKEAEATIRAIDRDWDKHDFRAVRDLYQANPGDVDRLQRLCRSYLAVHTDGRFRAAATELLRWTERVTTEGEYKVILRSGDFSKKVAAFFSRGPSLSVEIEVNGVRHGPSSIVKRRYDPDWDYTFPRRIRWKLGQPVRIRVKDNYYWTRMVADISSDANDRLAIKMLSGMVSSGGNELTFESDFKMPVMPKIE